MSCRKSHVIIGNGGPARWYGTHPYAMTTAPSSSACCTVLYCVVVEFDLSPARSTANFSSMFLLSGRMMDMGGIRMPLTNDFMRSVKAAATLFGEKGETRG